MTNGKKINRLNDSYGFHTFHFSSDVLILKLKQQTYGLFQLHSPQHLIDKQYNHSLKDYYKKLYMYEMEFQ